MSRKRWLPRPLVFYVNFPDTFKYGLNLKVGAPENEYMRFSVLNIYMGGLIIPVIRTGSVGILILLWVSDESGFIDLSEIDEISGGFYQRFSAAAMALVLLFWNTPLSALSPRISGYRREFCFVFPQLLGTTWVRNKEFPDVSNLSRKNLTRAAKDNKNK